MEFKQTPSKQRYTAKRLVKDSTVLAMRGLGYMLSLFFLCLLAMLTYSFVHDICGFYSSIKHNNVLSTVLLITGILVSLNTLFNFLMASFTKPGGTQHLKYLAKNLEERCENALLRINNDVDSEDEEDLENNSITKGKICLKCKSFKPLRSHHCSICNSCVLRMDHHCPWINNCVGHQNHRYYLLLLSYLTIGTGFYALTALSVRLSPELKQYKMTTMFDLMFLFCFVIFAVILPFTSWHWYLAMTGQTTIEFAERKAFSSHKELIQNNFYNFRQTKVSQNLEYIFGTKSFFKIFFYSVNCKTLDHEGVDWDDYIIKS